MDESINVSLDSSVHEESHEEDLKENKIKQSSRRSSKRSRGQEDLDDPEKVEKRSSRRSKKTKADSDEEESFVEEPIVEEHASEEPVAEEETNGNTVNYAVFEADESDKVEHSADTLHEVVHQPLAEENVVQEQGTTEGQSIEHETVQTNNEDDVMEAQNEDVVEVKVPEKQKPEMIVLDDINDDDGPGPDEVPTAEERGFWKAVEENPNDFASWTYLLQVVEKNGKLKQIQKAFFSFLQLYPYCYGYWKKYADQMKKIVSNEAAFQVYNDAVVAIPLSVDLWTYFIHFIAEWKDGDENEIRT